MVATDQGSRPTARVRALVVVAVDVAWGTLALSAAVHPSARARDRVLTRRVAGGYDVRRGAEQGTAVNVA